MLSNRSTMPMKYYSLSKNDSNLSCYGFNKVVNKWPVRVFNEVLFIIRYLFLHDLFIF